MRDWKRTEKGLPNKDEKVIVAFGNDVTVGRYVGRSDKGSDVWLESGTDEFLHGVKAWMPLPEMTAEKTAEEELDAKLQEMSELGAWFSENAELVKDRYAVFMSYMKNDTGIGMVSEVGYGKDLAVILTEGARPVLDGVDEEIDKIFDELATDTMSMLDWLLLGKARA